MLITYIQLHASACKKVTPRFLSVGITLVQFYTLEQFNRNHLLQYALRKSTLNSVEFK